MSKKFDLGNSASHLLHRAQQMAANKSAAALKSAGITLRQFSVLSAISEEEGVSQSKLVDITGIDRSTLADMAARMEATKLIKRVQSKTDARAKSLTLMTAGRKALQKATPGVLDADVSLLDAIAVSRRGTFLKTLTALAEEGEAAAAPAAPKKAVAQKAAPKKAAPKKAAAKKAAPKKAVKKTKKKVAVKKTVAKKAPVKKAAPKKKPAAKGKKKK